MHGPFPNLVRVAPPLFAGLSSAFKVRELIDGAVVRLVWCPTDENAADIFTKSLGTRKFKKFQAFLLGLPQDGEFKALICRMLFQ